MKLVKSTFKYLGLGLLAVSFSLMQSCKDGAEENVTDGDTESSDPALIKANTVTPTETSNSDVALNPAHGQPGHRCDIKVGAPLNGDTSTNNAQSPVLNSGGITPAGDLTVNPPHGQPGHRCDIKVGDPLPDA